MEHCILAMIAAFIIPLMITINLYKDILDRVMRTVALVSIDHPKWLQRTKVFASLHWQRLPYTGRHLILSASISILRARCAVSPAGSSCRANSVFALALLLRKQFSQTGKQCQLAEAIDLFQEGMSLQHNYNSDKSRVLSGLADSLLTYFNQTGEESLLIEAINLNREAMFLHPAGHTERSTSCRNLAKSLLTRFNQMGEQSLLVEAMDLNREALSLCPIGHPERSMSCNNLGESLLTHFSQTGEQSLLAEAVDLHREALSLRPIGHPERYISCKNLGESLWTHFNRTGEQSLLAEAIHLNREALSLCPIGHPGRFEPCNNLAVLLETYFKQTGDELLLAESIDLHREALSLLPTEHPDRHVSCNNLALALWTLFDRTGQELLLIESIDLNREALSVLTPEHPHRSVLCNNLALSLWTRFRQAGEDSLLFEAIHFHREALFLRPIGHPERHMSCNNLALSLWSRFKQAGEESLLVEAIDLQREVLSLLPTGHPNRAVACNNLALSLRTCFDRTGQELLLFEGIDLHREAISLHPIGHPDRYTSYSHLAQLLWTLYVRTREVSLLSEAITLSNEAIASQPERHPGRWMPITNLIRIYLDPRSSEQNLIYGLNYMQEAVSLISDDWPTLLSSVAELTGLIDLPMLTPDSRALLLQCFSAAFDLASRVAGFVLGPESQLRYLEASRHLGPRAYWCAMASGQPCLGLELIERARAMMWTQALHMQSPQLGSAPLELASELERLLRKMNASRVLQSPASLPSNASISSLESSSTEQDEKYKNSMRINQLIEQIRAVPGHEGFMRGLSFKELAHCASRSLVVMLIATEGECHALILQPSEQAPFILKLADIAPAELETISIYEAAQMRGSESTNVNDHRMGMKMSSSKTRNPALAKLWMMVVKPIIHCLRLQKTSGSLRPRLHWCPTGPFTSLPLHAAGIYDVSEPECCADYVVSSYTPTLTALLRAQQSRPSFHRQEAKLGLVAAMKAWDITMPPLRSVEDEISLVRAAAETVSITVDDSNICIGDAAIVARTAEVLQSTNFAHIACHGYQLNSTKALSSGFCLTDGNLSISHLMNLDMKDAFFAFLSACETAKGDENQPDQTIHLAAAMMFVGFRSVVATMWAMNDADGPRVAEVFYKRLFAEEIITLDAIPYALDHAIEDLRKSGVTPERWATFIHMGA